MNLSGPHCVGASRAPVFVSIHIFITLFCDSILELFLSERDISCYHFMARLLLSGFPSHGQVVNDRRLAGANVAETFECKSRDKRKIFHFTSYHMEASMTPGGNYDTEISHS